MTDLEIWVMKAPQRNIHKSIVKMYDNKPNVHVHQELAKYITRKSGRRRYIIRDIQHHIYEKFLETDGEHLLIIQDDMWLGKNFDKAIDWIVREGVLREFSVFYCPKNLKRNPGFIVKKCGKTNDFIRGMANLHTRNFVETLVKEQSIIPHELGFLGSDEYVITILHKYKMEWILAYPSFAQHAQMKSVIGNNPRATLAFDPELDLLKLTKEYY